MAIEGFVGLLFVLACVFVLSCSSDGFGGLPKIIQIFTKGQEPTKNMCLMIACWNKIKILFHPVARRQLDNMLSETSP